MASPFVLHQGTPAASASGLQAVSRKAMSRRQIRTKPSFADEDEEADDAAAEFLARKSTKGKKGAPLSGKGEAATGKGSAAKPVAAAAPARRAAALQPAAVQRLELAATGAGASTQRSAPGEYSKERLSQLRAGTKSLPAAKAPAPTESAFKLSGSFKKAGAAQDDRFEAPSKPQPTQQPAGDAADGENPLPPPPRNSKAAAAVQPGEDEDLAGFQAPDAATIRKIKEKRARLQGAHIAPDYIPLGGMASALSTDAGPAGRPGGGNAAAEVQPASGSDSEPEAEEGLRLAFGATAHQRGKAPPGVLASLSDEQQALHGEDADDDSRWVDQQIQKGAGRALAAAQARNAAGGGGDAAAAPGAAQRKPAAAAGAAVARLQQPDAIAAGGDAVIKALQDGVARAQASHKAAERQLARTTLSLADSIKAVGAIEGDLQAAGDKYVAMQRLRAFIADLCDMLQAKSPIVETLQDHLLQLQEQRGAAAADRAAADEREEGGPAEAGVQAAMGCLSRGGAEQGASAAAREAAEAARQQMLDSLPARLDEFGRDENLDIRDRMQRRHAAREQRRAAQARRLQEQEGAAEPRLGEATSDESDGEVRHYRHRREEILEAAASVFSDAAEQYGSLPAVRDELQRWKQRQAASYRDAHMSLSLPALLAPFVRLQLLAWDPLYGSSGQGLDGQQWYQQLFDFGALHGEGNGAAAPPQQQDADEELIPHLVQELALPMAKHALQHAWDPFSRRSTGVAAKLVEEMLIYGDAGDARLQALLKLVTQRLAVAVASMRLPSWPLAATTAHPPAATYAGRKFGRALRLLRNLAAFEGLLSRRELLGLALQCLSVTALVPHLRAATGNIPVAIDRAARVAAALPAAWTEAGVPAGGQALQESLHALCVAVEAQRHKSTPQQTKLVRMLNGALRGIGDAARADQLLQTSAVRA